MTERTFERTSTLPVPAPTLYDWHARPGAFERLVPPWESVELLGDAAPLEEGARQTMDVSLGPLTKRWTAEIREVRPGASFRDVQLSGPFAKWEHTHAMEARGEHESLLRDHIEYALPVGPFGDLAAGRSVGRTLERTFAYRHRLTRRDLARHADAGERRWTVLVTGSSGLVGSALCAFLSTGGHEVRRMVREPGDGRSRFRWDPTRGEFDRRALQGVDAVVHLAGENVGSGRWTEDRKRRIRESRELGTRLVADEVARARARGGPRVLVQASAIGFYGDRGEEELTESSASGEGFLPDVARRWEGASEDLEGVRVARLRFGVILTPAGGALSRMLVPFRLGAGGPVGSGKQWMSWVSLDDAVGAIHRALWDDGLEGAANVVAPEPIRNADFGKTLGRVLRRPALAPLPAFAVRAAFGELGETLLLASQRVRPAKLAERGFRFDEPTLEGALRHVLGATDAATH